MNSIKDLHDPGSPGMPNSNDSSADTTTTGGAKVAIARKKLFWRLFLAVLLIYIGVGLYQTCIKPLPRGLSLEGELHAVADGDVEFLYDVTVMKGDRRASQQMIFDHALSLIREAQDFLLVDLFLFNEYLGKDGSAHRKLCEEVSTALIEKKRSRPDIRMVVITDPVNQVYGGPIPRHFKELREAGIPVVLTDLSKLRDSNPIYSASWRIFAQWFGTSEHGSFRRPFAKDMGGVDVRSWLAMLNFKANHRKLLVADAPTTAGGRQMVCLVTSANPHDGSSAHNNVGLLVRGGIWEDLLRSEQAVLSLSGQDIALSSWLPSYAKAEGIRGSSAEGARGVTVRVLTEEKIRKGLLDILQSVREGDEIDIGMFYLSERTVIKALLDAAERGVSIRVLLDPNRDAFGHQKNGLPNRPVATELTKGGRGNIKVRWYDTHGEQFHTKMVLVKQGGQRTLFTGSANLTRRNIGDFNLETDVVVTGYKESSALQTAAEYFERLWANREHQLSVPYEAYADTSRLKRWQYRLQEWSGASTF
jgi:HKD family nuclease